MVARYGIHTRATSWRVYLTRTNVAGMVETLDIGTVVQLRPGVYTYWEKGSPDRSLQHFASRQSSQAALKRRMVKNPDIGASIMWR